MEALTGKRRLALPAPTSTLASGPWTHRCCHDERGEKPSACEEGGLFALDHSREPCGGDHAKGAMGLLSSSLPPPHIILSLLLIVLASSRPASASWNTCGDATRCTCNETKKEVNCQYKDLKAVPSGIPADTEPS
ncbi:unnamed protein product [Lampetra fluviatilis]